MVPRKLFFTKGVGRHREKLASFELALRDAEIEKFNLVRVSSILPPDCKIISEKEGVKELSPGEIVYCVLSEASSNEPGRKVAASIGAAIPRDGKMYGYLSEHHAYGMSEKRAGDYAEDLAAMMLASTLGMVDFDLDKSWDDEREIWKVSGKIVRTKNISIATSVPDTGKWTTVIAAAVFIG